MGTIDWDNYVKEQLNWADKLVEAGCETKGTRGKAMVAKGRKTRADANEILNEVMYGPRKPNGELAESISVEGGEGSHH